MDDDSRVVDRGWDALPDYAKSSGDADDAVTVSISTTPGEWLVNTVDSVVVPMSMAEVVDALRTHQLNLRSLVWRAGMQEWAPVERVPQLKIAARLDERPATPSAPAAVATSPTKAVGARETAKTIPPQRRSSPAAQVLPSRRSTLPFGLPSSGRPSSPLAASSPRVSSSPLAASSPRARSSPLASVRPAIPPADGEEQDVLAVYDRPVPTVSFDLEPVEPERTAGPVSSGAPPTLAPTTTDARSRFSPRSADLSVVAASHFRESQRSSKRWIVISSVASAAAASLLTFALSGRAPEPPVAARAPEVATALPAAAAAASATVVATAEVPAVVSEPSAVPPSASAAPEPPPKPKARRAKARWTPPKRPAAPAAEAESTSSPAAEPNPYDVKLEDEPTPSKPPAAHGSGLGDDTGAMEAPPATDPSTTPGF